MATRAPFTVEQKDKLAQWLAPQAGWESVSKTAFKDFANRNPEHSHDAWFDHYRRSGRETLIAKVKQIQREQARAREQKRQRLLGLNGGERDTRSATPHHRQASAGPSSSVKPSPSTRPMMDTSSDDDGPARRRAVKRTAFKSDDFEALVTALAKADRNGKPKTSVYDKLAIKQHPEHSASSWQTYYRNNRADVDQAVQQWQKRRSQRDNEALVAIRRARQDVPPVASTSKQTLQEQPERLPERRRKRDSLVGDIADNGQARPRSREADQSAGVRPETVGARHTPPTSSRVDQSSPSVRHTQTHAIAKERDQIAQSATSRPHMQTSPASPRLQGKRRQEEAVSATAAADRSSGRVQLAPEPERKPLAVIQIGDTEEEPPTEDEEAEEQSVAAVREQVELVDGSGPDETPAGDTDVAVDNEMADTLFTETDEHILVQQLAQAELNDESKASVWKFLASNYPMHSEQEWQAYYTSNRSRLLSWVAKRVTEILNMREIKARKASLSGSRQPTPTSASGIGLQTHASASTVHSVTSKTTIGRTSVSKSVLVGTTSTTPARPAPERQHTLAPVKVDELTIEQEEELPSPYLKSRSYAAKAVEEAKRRLEREQVAPAVLIATDDEALREDENVSEGVQDAMASVEAEQEQHDETGQQDSPMVVAVVENVEVEEVILETSDMKDRDVESAVSDDDDDPRTDHSEVERDHRLGEEDQESGEAALVDVEFQGGSDELEQVEDGDAEDEDEAIQGRDLSPGFRAIDDPDQDELRIADAAWEDVERTKAKVEAFLNDFGPTSSASASEGRKAGSRLSEPVLKVRKADGLSDGTSRRHTIAPAGRAVAEPREREMSLKRRRSTDLSLDEQDVEDRRFRKKQTRDTTKQPEATNSQARDVSAPLPSVPEPAATTQTEFRLKSALASLQQEFGLKKQQVANLFMSANLPINNTEGVKDLCKWYTLKNDQVRRTTLGQDEYERIKQYVQKECWTPDEDEILLSGTDEAKAKLKKRKSKASVTHRVSLYASKRITKIKRGWPFQVD
ncbi:hypothetical protein ACM66B_004883 [Microbotryomycetes sp. NB124-2]